MFFPAFPDIKSYNFSSRSSLILNTGPFFSSLDLLVYNAQLIISIASKSKSEAMACLPDVDTSLVTSIQSDELEQASDTSCNTPSTKQTLTVTLAYVSDQESASDVRSRPRWSKYFPARYEPKRQDAGYEFGNGGDQLEGDVGKCTMIMLGHWTMMVLD